MMIFNQGPVKSIVLNFDVYGHTVEKLRLPYIFSIIISSIAYPPIEIILYFI